MPSITATTGFAEELKVTVGLKIDYSRDQEIECV